MKVVYLHNRKTAGTSFKVLMSDLLGVNQVFWKHSSIIEKDFLDLNGYKVFGGHFSINNAKKFIEDDEGIIYFSCVREPIDRVVSLYNHHRTKDNWTGKVKGFDDLSLENTFNNCDRFRGIIENEQCYFISGSPNFESVLSILDKENFIIGSSERINDFMGNVIDVLNLGEVRLPESNRAVGNAKDGTEISEALYIKLRSFLSEDYKLYEWVKNKVVFNNVSIKYDISKYFSRDDKTITSSMRKNVIISSSYKSIKVFKGEDFFIPVRILNKNFDDLPTFSEKRVFSSYHIFNKNGVLLQWDGVRSNLPKYLKSNKKMNSNVKVKGINELGSYIIKIGLLHETISWFESDNSEHEIEVEVDIV